MSLAALLMLTFAIGVVLVNLLYSLLSALQFRLRERRWPDSLPTGIPLAGPMAVLAATALAEGALPLGWIILLIVADSGGPLALSVEQWHRWRIARRERHNRGARLHPRAHH